MCTESLSAKISYIFIIGIVCYIASAAVFLLVSDREGIFNEAKSYVAGMWGQQQTISGPVLVLVGAPNPTYGTIDRYFILPKQVTYEVSLEPEVRKKGIFNTTVYTEVVKISGIFSAEDIQRAGVSPQFRQKGILSVPITDTRGIEKQVDLAWNDVSYPFAPGSGNVTIGQSGVHAEVALNQSPEYAFSFSVRLKGSESMSFVPVGQETDASIVSSWQAPEFVGSFLPEKSDITSDGFSASWKVSSFGRSFSQVIREEEFDPAVFAGSAFGVHLNEGVDFYTQMYRSVKYAILFIVVTFVTFFLFEVLTRTRMHSIQYLLIGAALALFYLLLLSLAEHIGFAWAYVAATGMITGLVTIYSASILNKKSHSLIIATLLIVLYGYLYFVLQLEEYALLFGAFLLFALLGSVMYLTKDIDWFSMSEHSQKS